MCDWNQLKVLSMGETSPHWDFKKKSPRTLYVEWFLLSDGLFDLSIHKQALCPLTHSILSLSEHISPSTL